MRLDKFLKVSRLIKRRTVAKEVCENGRIEINGKIAKAASQVSPGDLLTINLGSKVLTVKILAVPETTKSSDAKDYYELVSEEYKNL